MAEAEVRSSSSDRASNQKLNWLRAAVLGANDGIVSVSSIILGVAGATTDKHSIFIAGLAGLVAGAFSMGVGEFVSVSSQRDTEDAYIAREKRRLQTHADEEFEELAQVYQNKGLSAETAHLVAKELTDKDAVRAHLDAELNLDEDDLNSPSQAAIASFVSFTIGGLIPLIAVLVATQGARIIATFVAVVIALIITGFASATVGDAPRTRAVIRVVLGGIIAMGATYFVGHLFGTRVS